MPRRDPTVSRRLFLLGAAGAGGAAVLARLPGEQAAAARTQVLPAVLEAEPRSEPATLAGAEPPAPPRVHDVVIGGGRVLDPETGFDAEAELGIDGGTITAISEDGLEGRTRIDAAGLVVAPGFIDLLSYEPNPYGVWFKVADGVTTTMGMHGLNDEAGPFFERWGNDPPPVNYGGAFDPLRPVGARASAWARPPAGSRSASCGRRPSGAWPTAGRASTSSRSTRRGSRPRSWRPWARWRPTPA